MVPMSERKDINPDVHKSMQESAYMTYKNKKASEDTKKSALYRYLFPKDANYESSTKAIIDAHPTDRYNPANGYYATYSNNFRDHYQE